ncbi:MAG: 5-deoxy-glucuronate isomerase [Candidatus Latescibacterota bacterium]
MILSGHCTVQAGGQTFEAIGARLNVFSGAPYTVYVPCEVGFEIVGIGDVEIALCKAPSDLACPVRLITPPEVKTKSVGRLNWRRDIRDILDADVPAKHLVIGETLTPPGHWSSTPPHRHDFDQLPEEADMEEVYFFKVAPHQGFGIQRVYTDNRTTDEAYAIEENDAVVLPEGYHPVVAGPGYRLYYLWILAGSQRVLSPRDDPAHAWLKNVEPIAEELGL